VHGVDVSQTAVLLDRIIDLERRLHNAQEAKRTARRSRDLWKERAMRYRAQRRRYA
jgi:hypothetical protein